MKTGIIVVHVLAAIMTAIGIAWFMLAVLALFVLGDRGANFANFWPYMGVTVQVWILYVLMRISEGHKH